MVRSVGQKPLTEDDVKLYNTRGYFLHHEQLFSGAELDDLEAIFEEHRNAAGREKG